MKSQKIYIMSLFLLVLHLSPSSSFFFPRFFERRAATSFQTPKNPNNLNNLNTNNEPPSFHVPKALCLACGNFPWMPVEGKENITPPNSIVEISHSGQESVAQEQTQPFSKNNEKNPGLSSYEHYNSLPVHQHLEVTKEAGGTVVINALGPYPEPPNRRPNAFSFGGEKYQNGKPLVVPYDKKAEKESETKNGANNQINYSNGQEQKSHSSPIYFINGPPHSIPPITVGTILAAQHSSNFRPESGKFTLPPQQNNYGHPQKPHSFPTTQNYGPPTQKPQQNTYGPPPQNPPQNNYGPPVKNPQNNYGSPVQKPTQNTYGPPQNNYGPPLPQNNYGPPVKKPQNNYGPPPQNNYGPLPQNNYGPPMQKPQNNYGPPQNNYGPPVQKPTQNGHSSQNIHPQNNYFTLPQNLPAQNSYGPPPQNNYGPPPQNSYGLPVQKPDNNYSTPPQNLSPQNNYGHPIEKPSQNGYVASAQQKPENNLPPPPQNTNLNIAAQKNPPQNSYVPPAQNKPVEQNNYGSSVQFKPDQYSPPPKVNNNYGPPEQKPLENKPTNSNQIHYGTPQKTPSNSYGTLPQESYIPPNRNKNFGYLAGFKHEFSQSQSSNFKVPILPGPSGTVMINQVPLHSVPNYHPMAPMFPVPQFINYPPPQENNSPTAHQNQLKTESKDVPIENFNRAPKPGYQVFEEQPVREVQFKLSPPTNEIKEEKIVPSPSPSPITIQITSNPTGGYGNDPVRHHSSIKIPNYRQPEYRFVDQGQAFGSEQSPSIFTHQFVVPSNGQKITVSAPSQKLPLNEEFVEENYKVGSNEEDEEKEETEESLGGGGDENLGNLRPGVKNNIQEAILDTHSDESEKPKETGSPSFNRPVTIVGVQKTEFAPTLSPPPQKVEENEVKKEPIGHFEIIPAAQYDITHLFQKEKKSDPSFVRPIPIHIPIPEGSSNSHEPLFVVSEEKNEGSYFGQPTIYQRGSIVHNVNSFNNEPKGDESKNDKNYGGHYDPLPPSIVSALHHAQRTSFLTHSHHIPQTGNTIYVNSITVSEPEKNTQKYEKYEPANSAKYEKTPPKYEKYEPTSPVKYDKIESNNNRGKVRLQGVETQTIVKLNDENVNKEEDEPVGSFETKKVESRQKAQPVPIAFDLDSGKELNFEKGANSYTLQEETILRPVVDQTVVNCENEQEWVLPPPTQSSPEESGEREVVFYNPNEDEEESRVQNYRFIDDNKTKSYTVPATKLETDQNSGSSFGKNEKNIESGGSEIFGPTVTADCVTEMSTTEGTVPTTSSQTESTNGDEETISPSSTSPPLRFSPQLAEFTQQRLRPASHRFPIVPRTSSTPQPSIYKLQTPLLINYEVPPPLQSIEDDEAEETINQLTARKVQPNFSNLLSSSDLLLQTPHKINKTDESTEKTFSKPTIITFSPLLTQKNEEVVRKVEAIEPQKIEKLSKIESVEGTTTEKIEGSSMSTKIIKTVRVRQRMRPEGGFKNLGNFRGSSRVRIVGRPLVSSDYAKTFTEFSTPSEGDEEVTKEVKNALIDIKKI